MKSARIHITGIVQGVGFRPFVFNLANQLAISGWVRNTSSGVYIAADGTEPNLKIFIERLRSDMPPLAQIDRIEIEPGESSGAASFTIQPSEAIPHAFQPISPDVATCPDCLEEIFDPSGRRYHYAFTNCTNCGPRFTIITDIPYDRPNTTMAEFTMCPQCSREYQDPTDRRFHAQPIACPTCGPQVWFESNCDDTAPADSSPVRGYPAIETIQQLLLSGKILAIKGLGGFHIACDATNPGAVSELRRRKLRVDKPFALMMADLATVERCCLVSPEEEELLTSRLRPIVILQAKSAANIASQVAPGQGTLGVMLPYTPLHYLIFQDIGGDPMPPLVMTSGNMSEEPIATDNAEARVRLQRLVDGFLMHDRPIRTRCDDSVVRSIPKGPSLEIDSSKIAGSKITASRSIAASRPQDGIFMFLRRSRGYAPAPLSVPWDLPPILAAGAELKNTFCLSRDRYAFLSHHIGDLENYETLQSFEDGIRHFETLFRIQPEYIAHDLHPDYMATRYALARAEQDHLPAFGIQHHHAHIAACMAENELPPDLPVIGVAFDGTGYGSDGAIWGGEILLATYRSFQRYAHLAYTPLPGGDKAIHEPWRMALSWLYQAGIPWDLDLPPVQYALAQAQNGIHLLEIIRQQITKKVNSPQTSSIGRLFDAVGALVGIRQVVNYEAQAAIELEAQHDPLEPGDYPLAIIRNSQWPHYLDPSPMFSAICSDLRLRVNAGVISSRFHRGLIKTIVEIACSARQETSIRDIILSGGVWQNATLLAWTVPELEKNGFNVWLHRKVPANDGGLSFGQTMVAAFNIGTER